MANKRNKIVTMTIGDDGRIVRITPTAAKTETTVNVTGRVKTRLIEGSVEVAVNHKRYPNRSV
jgi:hypothetical protein